jgi:hypothetical protein
MTDARSRDDLAIMSTSDLVDWWLAREGAISGLRVHVDRSRLVVTLDEPPKGTTLEVVSPRGVRTLHEMS